MAVLEWNCLIILEFINYVAISDETAGFFDLLLDLYVIVFVNSRFLQPVPTKVKFCKPAYSQLMDVKVAFKALEQ